MMPRPDCPSLQTPVVQDWPGEPIDSARRADGISFVGILQVS